MFWAFLASPALSARRPPRVPRHAPARSQLSVSIFDLVAGQDDTRLADLPALCEWVEGAGGDGLVAVEVESTPDRGLGLRTTQAVKRGDVLLSVPITLALGNSNPNPNPNPNTNTNTNTNPNPNPNGRAGEPACQARARRISSHTPRLVAPRDGDGGGR